MEKRIWSLVIVSIFAITCLPGLLGSRPAAQADGGDDAKRWSSLITSRELHDRLADPKLLIIDVRSHDEYTAGHIPGAINIPGTTWRTPPTKNPAKDGPGQKIFRGADGKLDVARYEALLSAAGVTPEHRIVVYGNHAGKADGSVPAAILNKLGHVSVAFLDGVGLERWQKDGFEVSTTPRRLDASKYTARPDATRLWTADDVLKNLDNKDVVIIDSRTAAEYAGEDTRGNKRGGHIPGAKLLSSDDFLDKETGTTISREAARAKIEAVIPQGKGKTVVIYCQSGTRCSHEELILKDLGFDNVILYDASWQEWGNREDLPLEKPKK